MAVVVHRGDGARNFAKPTAQADNQGFGDQSSRLYRRFGGGRNLARGRICGWCLGNPAGEGYFNFEMNCIGTMLAAKRTSKADARHFGPELMAQIRNFGTLKHEVIDSQEEGQTWWRVEMIPFSVLGLNEAPASLRGNFYKCGDKCAVPHFLSWSEIGLPAPNFHCPDFFGEITLKR